MKCSIAVIVVIGLLSASSAEIAVQEESEQQYRILSISSPAKNTLTPQLSTSTLQQLKSTKRAEVKEEVTTDFNQSADYVVKMISAEILMKGLDPASTYNHDITFQYRPLLLTYTGTLKLTNGFIQELSTVAKRDDSVLGYDIPPVSMRVYIPLSFGNIIAGYNFEMNVKGDTVKGVLYAWAKDATADHEVEISLVTLSPITRSFTVNMGSFEIQIFSESISSSYRNLISQLVNDFMRNVIDEQTESIVGNLINQGVLSIMGLN